MSKVILTLTPACPSTKLSLIDLDTKNANESRLLYARNISTVTYMVYINVSRIMLCMRSDLKRFLRAASKTALLGGSRGYGNPALNMI